MILVNYVCLLLVLLLLGSHRVEMRLKNVAIGKPAAQNKDYFDWYSRRATDGIVPLTNDYFTCTATDTQINSWWVVDLLQSFTIGVVRIQNRIAASYRLTNFYVYASRSNPISALSSNNPEAGDLCLHHPGNIPDGRSGLQELHCNSPIEGRYVYVWKPANEELHICEFEVLVDVGVRKTVPLSEMVYAGTRSSLTPVYSRQMEMGAAPGECCAMCMSAAFESDNEATNFQVNRQTGVCECLRYSPLGGSNLNPTLDGDWDIWDLSILSEETSV